MQPIFGSGSNLQTFMNIEPKPNFVDQQANGNIRHLFKLGKAEDLARHPFYPGSQLEVFAFDFRRVPFTYLVLCRIYRALVGRPVVGVKALDL